jgi:5-methylcytosine-specific restriction protein A
VASNPPWTSDELVLALDLYLRRRSTLPGREDPEVIELSRLLNALPIHTTRPNLEHFRNANSVAMKLANFAALDPQYPGAGLRAGGRLDAIVFDRYAEDSHSLTVVAASLRRGVVDDLFPTVPDPDEDDLAAEEGRLLYRLHRSRERSPALARRKKAQAAARLGRLRCEICGFDFAERYGSLGDGFIECHHVLPLARAGERVVRLTDLALLCSNCHRMIHRAPRWLSVDELRQLLVV